MSHIRSVQRSSRLLAGLLAAVLTISGVALGAIPAQAADAPVANPVITVTPNADLDPSVENVLTVSGTGFVGAGAALGAYVVFGDSNIWSGNGPLVAEGWVQLGWVMPRQIVDGAFTTTLTVPAGALVDGIDYAVGTSAAHGLSATDRSLDAFAPVTIVQTVEPAVATTTTLSASPVGASVQGTAVTLSATVSPTASGTVSFFDADAAIASDVAVVDGVATFAVTNPALGAHSFRAEFTSADEASFLSSVSAAVTHSVTAPVEPEHPTPTVTLSKTSGIDAAGETITVTGSGFVPNAPATSGTRPPLAGKFTGAYVVFGSFLENWQPSASAPSSARKVIEQKWGVHQADLATIGGPAAGGIVIAEDGTFSTSLTVREAAALENGRWGIYTYGGGGAKYAPFETFTPITFAEVAPEPVPTITVTPNSDLDPSVENVITISGTGFTGEGAKFGAYVLFGDSAIWSGNGPLVAEGWLQQGWVMPRQVVDGAFTTTLTIPAGTLVEGVDYTVATSAAHGLSATDRSLDTFAPVTIAEAVVPVEPELGISADSVVQGGELTVTGRGFDALSSVSLALHSDPISLGTAVASATGAFSFTAKIPANVPAGAHTIVATAGAVTVSIPVTVTAAVVPVAPVAPTTPVCLARAVNGASFEWGVKASFASYVTGGIAKGAVAGGWGSGSGAYSTDTGNGRVAFGGSMNFTGHAGALDMNLSNPRVRVSGSTATLILDVNSKGFNGSPGLNASGVNFATLSLPSGSTSGSSISWSNVPATLTAAGAEAFAGFYSAGDALDPVSITFPLGAVVACDSTTDGLATTGGEPAVAALGWGALLLVAGLALTVIRRRRLIES